VSDAHAQELHGCAGWRRVVTTLRVAAWRLFTPPWRRRAWVAELSGAADFARRSESRPVRELADGLAELAVRAGRRRSRKWARDGARDMGLQLARLIEQEHPDMPQKTFGKKPHAAKPAARKPTRKPPVRPAKTVAARTAKTAASKVAKPAEAPKATRGQVQPGQWALAAFIAAQALADQTIQSWQDSSADAARLLYLRVEGLSAEPTDETMRGPRARPSGFTTWYAAAARFAEIAIWIPHRNSAGDRKGKHFNVSPYAIRVALDEKHDCFDPRGLLPPDPEMVASIDAVGGVLDSVKVTEIIEKKTPEIYAADGRQRRNNTIAANLLRLRRWWQAARASGRAASPPDLITSIPAERVEGGIKGAQRAGAVLNSGPLRRDDSLRDLAHRVLQLRKAASDGGAGLSRDEIASQLGISQGHVSNLLSLAKLTRGITSLLWSGKLAPACAYILATQEAALQDELWLLIEPLPPPRRAGFLKEVVALRARVAELEGSLAFYRDDASGKHAAALARVEKDLEAARTALATLEKGGVAAPVRPRAPKLVDDLRRRVRLLGGEGARLVNAVLDWTLGGGSEEVEALLKDLHQSPATTIDWRAIRCPGCCVDPGQACQDDDAEEWNEATGFEMKEPHPERVREAERLQLAKAGAAPPSTVDGAGTKKTRKERADARAARVANVMWAGFEEAKWEQADIWDERIAQEVAAAGLSPDDLARKKETLEHAGQTYGYLLSGGKMTIAQIQAALRQQPLVSDLQMAGPGGMV